MKFQIIAQDLRSEVPLEILNKIAQPIQICLVEINNANNKRTVLSTKSIEWRYSLTMRKEVKFENVRLGKFGDEDTPLGYINFKILMKSLQPPIDQKIFIEQLRRQRIFEQDHIKEFYDYAKSWWNDLKESHKFISRRVVKIYSMNEFGMLIPSCQFIHPLRSVEGIPTPELASRFVSLIPCRKPEETREPKDIWCRFHTIITRRAAEVEDHATLLCSLLLGFSLESYVVI